MTQIPKKSGSVVVMLRRWPCRERRHAEKARSLHQGSSRASVEPDYHKEKGNYSAAREYQEILSAQPEDDFR